MYPYLPQIGPFHLGHLILGPWQPGTFGLLLWLAAVLATVVLHRNFVRNGVDADALNVVALAVVLGILGAKAWHELQDVPTMLMALRRMQAPGWNHPLDILGEFLTWFRAGFAWFGGMTAGIAVLMWQGSLAKPDSLRGWWAGVRMLDLATPAAAVGYGVGRIGCLTSGDGDYGIKTTLPWGVHMAKNALVPTPDLVQPTPIYELLFSLALAWLLWRLGNKSRPVGWLTGLYLALSGLGRFLVEFVRVNPRLYWGMSNAQVAALASILVGGLVMVLTKKKVPGPVLVDVPTSASA
jgi:phosphatidylglycerol---prolipoprotein diacylglyceryl transferase